MAKRNTSEASKFDERDLLKSLNAAERQAGIEPPEEEDDGDDDNNVTQLRKSFPPPKAEDDETESENEDEESDEEGDDEDESLPPPPLKKSLGAGDNKKSDKRGAGGKGQHVPTRTKGANGGLSKVGEDEDELSAGAHGAGGKKLMKSMRTSAETDEALNVSAFLADLKKSFDDNLELVSNALEVDDKRYELLVKSIGGIGRGLVVALDRIEKLSAFNDELAQQINMPRSQERKPAAKRALRKSEENTVLEPEDGQRQEEGLSKAEVSEILFDMHTTGKASVTANDVATYEASGHMSPTVQRAFQGELVARGLAKKR